MLVIIADCLKMSPYSFVNFKWCVKYTLCNYFLCYFFQYRILLYISKQQQLTNAKITQGFNFSVSRCFLVCTVDRELDSWPHNLTFRFRVVSHWRILLLNCCDYIANNNQSFFATEFKLSAYLEDIFLLNQAF